MNEKVVFPQAPVEVLEEALRRCAIELSYVQTLCPGGQDHALCKSAEGNACIEEVERLLGPMKEWVRLYPASAAVNMSMR